MQSYLVEVYVPRSSPREASLGARRAEAAADALSGDGVPVRYVRTTFLPDDETCFHVFEAGSSDAVDEVCRRAYLGRARIVPVIEDARSSQPPPH